MLQHAVFMTIFLIININKNNNYHHLDSRKIFLWMTSQYNRVSWLVFLLIALVWHKRDILVMLTKVKLFKFVMFNSSWSNWPLLYWAFHVVDFPKIRQENPCHDSRWRNSWHLRSFLTFEGESISLVKVGVLFELLQLINSLKWDELRRLRPSSITFLLDETYFQARQFST